MQTSGGGGGDIYMEKKTGSCMICFLSVLHMLEHLCNYKRTKYQDKITTVPWEFVPFSELRSVVSTPRFHRGLFYTLCRLATLALSPTPGTK